MASSHPLDAKSPKAKMTVKKEDDHDYTGGKKVSCDCFSSYFNCTVKKTHEHASHLIPHQVKKARSESTMKPKYRKETVQKKEVPRRRTGRRK